MNQVFVENSSIPKIIGPNTKACFTYRMCLYVLVLSFRVYRTLSSLKFFFFWSAGAIQRLHQNNMLTADAIDRADETTIKNLIYPVYFLKKYIN